MIDILFVCALLASGTTANKIILKNMPVSFFVGLRMFLSGIILLVAIFRTSHNLNLKYLKQDWSKLILIACFTTFFPSIFKAYALKHMSLQKAVFLASFDPFVTAIYSFIFFGERLGIQKILGICIGFSGIIMSLFFISTRNEQYLLDFGIISYPELAALAAVFIGRYGWLMVAQIIKKNRYDTYEINGIMMLISGFLSLILSIYLGEFSLKYMYMPMSRWSALIYTILIGNIFAYTLWSQLFKKYSINFMSLVGFSIYIFASFYGYLIFDEKLTWNFVLASMVTFAGLLVFYHKENKLERNKLTIS